MRRIFYVEITANRYCINLGRELNKMYIIRNSGFFRSIQNIYTLINSNLSHYVTILNWIFNDFSVF